MNGEMYRLLISLREIKAMREVLKGKQERLNILPEQTPWEKATLPRKVKEA